PMPIQPPQCDPDLLRKAIDDSLSEQDEEILACHLSRCATCQRTLEELAAAKEEWLTVGAVLRQEAQNQYRTGGNPLSAARPCPPDVPPIPTLPHGVPGGGSSLSRYPGSLSDSRSSFSDPSSLQSNPSGSLSDFKQFFARSSHQGEGKGADNSPSLE